MAANELIIYTFGLVIAMVLFSLANTAAEGVMQGAMNQLDNQQSRYESVARTYVYASRGMNYNLSNDEAHDALSKSGDGDWCEYNNPRKSFTLLTPEGPTKMKVWTSDRGPVYDDCRDKFPFHPLWDDKDESYVHYPGLTVAVMTDRVGDDEGEIDLIRTSTAEKKQ